jgi:hypothetical protein
MNRGEEAISGYIRGARRLGILGAIGLGQFPAGSQAPVRRLDDVSLPKSIPGR